jgi:hypothetical protein
MRTAWWKTVRTNVIAMALLRRRGTLRVSGRAALVLLAVAATIPWLAEPALASPQQCSFGAIYDVWGVPVGSVGRCDSGTGQYAALVYCDNYSYHVTGPWKNAGSGEYSYAYCNQDWLAFYDVADFVGYTYRG